MTIRTIIQDSLVCQTFGRCRIIEEIGGGGMDVAQIAEDTQLHRSIALKSLPDGAVRDLGAFARLPKEST